jgi:arylsulfatase A-like enzyme
MVPNRLGAEDLNLTARTWRAGVMRPVVAYATGYTHLLGQPFSFLPGQLITFFAVSLYVKLVEMRLTPEYGTAWVRGGRLVKNWLHYLQFSAQEICLFVALLVALAVWRRYSAASDAVSRMTAWVIGLVCLPALSATEVLGLAHFALFLTPLGPEEVRMIGWTGHIVSASNILQLPEVWGGLVVGAAGYYLAPCGLWLRGVRWERVTLTWTAPLLALSLLAVMAPKPAIPNALLEPHPLLWMVHGNRPKPAWADTGERGAALGRGAGRARFSVREHPTNVVVFVLESTRAESVALYNPNARAGRELLRWRDETVVFDQVYAPVPTSAHALFSILYGRYPYLGPFWTSTDKSVAADSLAEYFARADYATQLYITSDLNFDNVRSFTAPGFERVLDPNDWPGQEQFASLPWGRDDRLLTDEIKRFITTNGKRPFFLLAMTSNPHHPYAVDQLPGQAPIEDPHAAYERLVDYDLGLLAELYQWLKVRGIAEHTLLLVLGDHGEAFGEHPGNFGHAGFIYEENVHIPCFILHPRRLGLPRRIAQLGSEVDLRATILDILGRTDAERGDGMSLLREDAERMIANFTENGVSHFGMRDAQFTYIYTPHVNAELLFDRRRDPNEGQDVAARDPRLTARYRTRLQQWEAWHQASLAKVLR